MKSSPKAVTEFRTFLPSDHDRLVQLWHRCDLTRPWNDPADDIRQCLENPSSELLIATIKDVLSILAFSY